MHSPAFSDVGTVLCEFFEVIAHNILFLRKLYPDVVFVKRKKYGTAVYQSVHPDVNEYISQVLKGAEFHAGKSQLYRLDLCIVSAESNEVFETFVFDVIGLKNRFKG